MSQTSTTTVKPPQGKEVWVPCGTCGEITCHHALTLVATSDSSPDGDIQVWSDHMIVQCGGCRTVSFCVQSSCSEDIVFNPQTEQEELAITHRVYPTRIAGKGDLEHGYLLPHVIYKVYEETRTALANDQPVLAGIGIRAIIETVCKDRSAAGKNLMEKIDDLAKKGDVTPDGAKILHSLRFMGNEAAHEVKAHAQADLLTALDVAEYVLKGVYILPKLATNLPKK